MEVHDDIITTHYSLHDVNKVGNCLGGGREEGGEGGREGGGEGGTKEGMRKGGRGSGGGGGGGESNTGEIRRGGKN